MIVLKREGKTYVPAHDYEDGAFEWISNPSLGAWREVG